MSMSAIGLDSAGWSTIGSDSGPEGIDVDGPVGDDVHTHRDTARAAHYWQPEEIDILAAQEFLAWAIRYGGKGDPRPKVRSSDGGLVTETVDSWTDAAQLENLRSVRRAG
ncbi:hypothetical protein MKZ38_009714 [Zalerion maritima]|uniref:Uncharacterized protein n=1 Tax=Zalerion maritima TaxID=339359 RepID=A0AAD5WLZ9_9PEZI|nr:hypothetical protein MKZ38_009714 [Zalerion maritima]